MLIDNNYLQMIVISHSHIKNSLLTWEDAKKDIQNFIRRLNADIKNWVKELKYILHCGGKNKNPLSHDHQ